MIVNIDYIAENEKKIATKTECQSDIYTRLIFDYCFIYEILSEI